MSTTALPRGAALELRASIGRRGTSLRVATPAPTGPEWRGALSCLTGPTPPPENAALAGTFRVHVRMRGGE